MARGIRFTKAERAVVKALLEKYIAETGVPRQRNADSALAKLEESELPVKKSTCLTVPDAIAAFRWVLGPRLIAPPFSAAGVLGQMKNRIQALGLTKTDCEAIAKVAGVEWEGQIRAESLVRQADKLLTESQLPLPTAPRAAPAGGAVELDDDDL